MFVEDIDWITSLILIISGLITVFAGKFLLRIVMGGLFGLLLGYIAVKLILFFHGSLIVSLIIGFLAFIIGFFLGWFILKLALSIVFGLIIGISLAYILGFTGNISLLILIIVISIGIAYLLSEKIISVAVIITGLALFFAGMYFLLHSIVYALVITVILLALVIYVKMVK